MARGKRKAGSGAPAVEGDFSGSSAEGQGEPPSPYPEPVLSSGGSPSTAGPVEPPVAVAAPLPSGGAWFRCLVTLRSGAKVHHPGSRVYLTEAESRPVLAYLEPA